MQLKALKAILADPKNAKTKSFSATEIEARSSCARGKHPEAVALLMKDTATLEKDPALLALLFDEFSRQGESRDRELYRNEAEALYKKFVSQNKLPGRYLVLAEFYNRQGRLDEALKYCDEAARDKAPPEAVANMMVATLRHGEPTAEQFRRVERWFEQAAKDGNADSLLLSLADLRDLQGRYQEAETLYSQVLGKNGNNLLAINNLAWLLALKEGKNDEALALLNRAIDFVGPSPELLDTRGVVYLKRGQAGADKALADLQACLEQSPSGQRYFHLAQVQNLANDREAAKESLKKARDNGLTINTIKQLHPLEQPAYRELLAALGME